MAIVSPVVTINYATKRLYMRKSLWEDTFGVNFLKAKYRVVVEKSNASMIVVRDDSRDGRKVHKKQLFVNVSAKRWPDVLKLLRPKHGDKSAHLVGQGKIRKNIPYVEIVAPDQDTNKIYTLQKTIYGMPVSAKMRSAGGKYVVLAGSVIHAGWQEQGTPKYVKKLRDEQLYGQKGGIFTTIRDVEFDNVSAAAEFVMGYSANGWIEWMDENKEPIDKARKSKLTD